MALPFSFENKALKIIKGQLGKLGKKELETAKKLWGDARSEMDAALESEIEEIFKKTKFEKNDRDKFGPAGGKVCEGVSVPITYVKTKAQQGVYQRNLKNRVFQAANLNNQTIEAITQLYFSFYFDKTLESSYLGKKIGASYFVLLEITKEAYEANSPKIEFCDLLKLGYCLFDKPDEILRSWKKRKKPYAPGSFYESKL